MSEETYTAFVARLMKPGEEIMKEMTPKKLELEHMANLLGSESGEVLTYVKRHVFYGQELDMPAIKKELGDVMFAFTAICNILGLEVEDIRELNQEKLTARYPLGTFSNEQAKARADESDSVN